MLFSAYISEHFLARLWCNYYQVIVSHNTRHASRQSGQVENSIKLYYSEWSTRKCIRAKNVHRRNLRHLTLSSITSNPSILRSSTPAASVSTKPQRDPAWKFIFRQCTLVSNLFVRTVRQNLRWNQILRSIWETSTVLSN